MDAEQLAGAVAGATSLIGKVGGAISGAIAAASKIKELADRTSNLELKELLVELREKLLDVKGENLEFREELDKLKAENKRLLAPPEVKIEKGMYYRLTGDGPYCTNCYDGKDKMIRLVETSEREQYSLHMNKQCPNCKTYYVGL